MLARVVTHVVLYGGATSYNMMLVLLLCRQVRFLVDDVLDEDGTLLQGPSGWHAACRLYCIVPRLA